MTAAPTASGTSSADLRRLAEENAWLRAALETAREEARLAREALRMGAARC